MECFEKWRPIRGFPDYEVSDRGRVRSRGTLILKPDVAKGYERVTLFVSGTRHRRQVHRLVADAFIHNPDGLPIVNHKDENKRNNAVDNLEWCTQMYNANYGSRNDRVSGSVSKPVIQMTMMGEYIRQWSSMSDAANGTGACLSEISKCCKNPRLSAGGYKWRRLYE